LGHLRETLLFDIDQQPNASHSFPFVDRGGSNRLDP
jgi:hypothetical protein